MLEIFSETIICANCLTNVSPKGLLRRKSIEELRWREKELIKYLILHDIVYKSL